MDESLSTVLYAYSTYSIYCGRVWNLIQACNVQSSDFKVYISTPPSPRVENFHIPCRVSNPGPAEPEADMLPSELARRAQFFFTSKPNAHGTFFLNLHIKINLKINVSETY